MIPNLYRLVLIKRELIFNGAIIYKLLELTATLSWRDTMIVITYKNNRGKKVIHCYLLLNVAA